MAGYMPQNLHRFQLQPRVILIRMLRHSDGGRMMRRSGFLFIFKCIFKCLKKPVMQAFEITI